MLHAIDDALLAVVDLANGRNDGRGAAHAALDKLVDLVELDRALLDLKAKVLGHLDQRATGDGGQDGVGEGLGNNQVAVLLDKDDVGAAGLLDVGAGLRVEEEVVGVALLVRQDAGVKRHGVVEAGLDVAGAVGSGAVVIGNLQLNGLDAALVVGAHGGHEDAELVLIGRLDANDVARCEHEGTHVERGARAKGRHPGGVGLDDLLDGLDKAVNGERRHAQALRRVVHALGVHIGTEAHDRAVLGGVGLQALEDLLAVVEKAGALGHHDRVVGGKLALAPLAVLIVANIAVVGVLVGKTQATPVDVLLLHVPHLLARARRPLAAAPLTRLIRNCLG